MKIAEALILRKHLAMKVEQLKSIKIQGENGLLEVKFQRKPATTGSSEAIDELMAQLPKIKMSDITAEFDLYASELRKLDSAIQEANWKFEIGYTQHADIK